MRIIRATMFDGIAVVVVQLVNGKYHTFMRDYIYETTREYFDPEGLAFRSIEIPDLSSIILDFVFEPYTFKLWS